MELNIKKYIVASLSSTGMAISLYVLAEIITEKEHSFSVKNLIKGMEVPTAKATTLQFLPDIYFTNTNESELFKSAINYWRYLDPNDNQDARDLQLYTETIDKIRALKTGLVLGGQMPQGPQK